VWVRVRVWVWVVDVRTAAMTTKVPAVRCSRLETRGAAEAIVESKAARCSSLIKCARSASAYTPVQARVRVRDGSLGDVTRSKAQRSLVARPRAMRGTSPSQVSCCERGHSAQIASAPSVTWVKQAALVTVRSAR